MSAETLTIIVRAEDFYALRAEVRALDSGELAAKLDLIPSLPVDVAADQCISIIKDIGRVGAMARVLVTNAVIKEVG